MLKTVETHFKENADSLAPVRIKFLERLRYVASASYEELKEKLFRKQKNTL